MSVQPGPLRRVLIVKTSSMGDVVHALPAVSDMRRAHPGLEVDWLVEAPFAAIARLHPGVRRVLPLAWRKWRKTLWRADTRAAVAALRSELRRDEYDLVLDLQGLLKSVLWGLQARGPLVGYDAASIREPAAAWFYRRRASVPRDLQAVERCRRLAAAHLGYAMPDSPPDFGLQAAAGSWQAASPSAALIPCASRPEKFWPEADWIAVGERLRAAGLTPVVIWGSAEERERAERIAAGCGGVVPPFLSVADMAAVLGAARQIVGLDTGFSHLAAAFGRPTIGIYCDHEPGLAGITGPGPVASFGGKGLRPGRDEVLAQLERHLALQG
ncbi:lipopolysaccharide heptosyltransferase I [Sphaerotilus microaerophilus]|uniref:Lipopolysaccharide heptosyltransferase 1 n=1 Tax=Sphaerotilus microaerophilus TaxID=2914710 RepID=A0ABM7YSK9_9BURK|nr:lipopolysaccharide heptosyltransferase I [Sphaerotilus sp. FB-5]BDI07593.1 lipopolysaccharide heptosyltransferase I [Sphaerotilus sp. FB-5]